jgi:hypothetical protein
MALGFIGNFLSRASNFMRLVRVKAAGLADRIKRRLNAGPKFKLIAAGAILGIVLAILGIILILNNRVRRPPDSEALTELFRMELPPDELFLDDEPDFLPDLLPERERRDTWNADDIRSYWTDPAEEDAGVYEDMMGAVVDEIMEHLP